MNDAIVPERVVALSPLVRRITQNNPGLMTGPGTNTYIVGNESLFIIDPGEDTDEHLSEILSVVGNSGVVGIAPTHAHPDHWPLAPRLAEELGTVTLGFKPHNGYVPARLVADGDLLRSAEWSLRAFHTPGHLSDHVSYYLEQEKALFSGDNVMAWSTSVITRPDGSLAGYLASLEILRSLNIAVIYPAHGGPVERAQERISELIEHRKKRTAEILQALGDGVETVPALVQRIYADVDPRLHPAAQQSVLSHLDDLLESGRARIKRQGQNALNTTYAIVL